MNLIKKNAHDLMKVSAFPTTLPNESFSWEGVFLLVVVVLLFDAFGLLGLHTSFWWLCLSGSGLCTLETQKPGQTHQGRSPEDVDRNDYRMLGQCRKATNPDQCNRCHRDGGHDQGQCFSYILH